jgi:hypothetical protein
MQEPVAIKPKFVYTPPTHAWLVTEDNMQQVADWCGGTIRSGGDMIVFPIRDPWADADPCCSSDGAGPGDYIVKYPDGFASYGASIFVDSYVAT